MAQVTLGNHAAVIVSLTEQDAVRRFYRDVLGCTLTRSAHDKDDFVLGGDFDPHLYFQAPGGQAFRLVGTDEDMFKYEGTTRHRELPGEVFS